jgi:uncharacterized iron-regulated membrane protein
MQSDFDENQGGAGTVDDQAFVDEVLSPDEHLEVDGDRAAPTLAPSPVRHPDARPVAKKRKKKRFGNRPIFRFVQVTHRWLALVTGVGLLLLVISGAILLYKAPINHVLDHDAYYPSTSAQTIGSVETIDIVQKAHPKTPIASAVHLPTGNWVASDQDGKKAWIVDASTGRITKEMNPSGGFFGLLDNFHECMLSCEGYPLYVAFLGKPIGSPFGDELTWASLILGVFGLVLLVLVIGGFYLWWPGIKKMARGFKIRRGNRYKFNYDLHKVVGFAALPFLAMWAITGANFELPFVTNLYYDLLPGDKPAEVEFESKPVAKGTKPITPTQARAAIVRDYPGIPIVAFTRADPSDPKSAYTAYLAHGFDPWKESEYPGDYGVSVDQFSGKTGVTFTDTFPHKSQEIEEQYAGTTHMGMLIGPWWRSIWLLFGLTPILLGITGTTTWWIRRGKAKDKKRRKKERERAAAAATA